MAVNGTGMQWYVASWSGTLGTQVKATINPTGRVWYSRDVLGFLQTSTSCLASRQGGQR